MTGDTEWRFLMVGRFTCLSVLLLCSSCSVASETPKYPLREVWAIDMPSTKELGTLLKAEEGEYIDRASQRLFDTARRTLLKKYPERESQKGFAVSKTDREALADVSRLLSEEGHWGAQPLESSKEISLVFFSHPSSYRVHIEKIDRHEDTFRIEYRFVPQPTVEPSIQLALIPVGKLPVGNYGVEMVQLPLEQEYLDAGFKPVSEEGSKRIVCQSYSFQVYERPAPDPGPAKDATVIPLDQIWALDMPGTKDVRELTSDPYADLSIGPLGVLELMGKQEAGAGYVVPGTGKEALLAARKKLPPGKTPANELPFGTDITVVYYSHAFMPINVLHRVERRGNTISIRFRHDGNGNTSYSSHYALIPLGKLSVGDYKVNMIATIDDVVEASPAFYLDIVDDIRRVVCKSFEFSVKPVNSE